MRRSPLPAVWLAILPIGLGLLLAACNSGATPDSSPPSLTITSSATSSGVTYHLTGKTGDNVGATKLSYQVDGGSTQTVRLSGGTFDVSVSLTPGVNTIDVTVYDAAGNETSKTFKVTFTPPAQDSLTISVSGLPTGVSADITVTGPNGYDQPVTAGTTLSSLADGSYTVAAAAVVAAGTVYEPGTASQNLTLSGGQAANASVSYAVSSTADIHVAITGLPTGTTGTVTVAGPGFSQDVTAETTLTGLAAGGYSITAADASDGTYTYQGTASPASITAAAGGAYDVTVTYAPVDGIVQVNTAGVPSGTTATIGIAGNGYSDSVTVPAGSSVTSFGHLAPAQYTISAPVITQSGTNDAFTATVTGSPAQVIAGTSTNVAVGYARTTDHLGISVNGLPSSSVSAAIVVTGPSSYQQPVTGDTTLTGLQDGTYQVQATNVQVGGDTYAPVAAAQSFVLSGGQDATAAVSYALVTQTTGSLTVTVGGLPGGVAANVVIMTAGGFRQTITGTATLSDLAPDTYQIAPISVADDRYIYGGTATPASVTVSAGATATSDVTYAPSSGAIDLTVTGLSSYPNTYGAIQLAGPGVTINADHSVLLGYLDAGTYTVTVGDVSNDLYDFHGTASSSTVVVAKGATANLHVDYQATTGALTVNVIEHYSVNTDIHVTGAGTDHVVPYGETLRHLAPATYTVTANDVSTGTYNLHGTVSSPTVVVPGGADPSVTVDYEPTDGAVDASFSGLPTGTSAGAELRPVSTGTTYTFDTSGTHAHVATGDYTWHTVQVTGSDQELYDDPADQNAPLTVTAGNTAAATLTYQQVSGDIQLTVSGTVTGTVTVSSRDGNHPFSQTSTGGLIPGLWASATGTDYNVIPNNAHDSHYDYMALSAIYTVHRKMIIRPVVNYQPADGAIQIAWSGLPSGSSYGATVTGSRGTSRNVTMMAGSTTLDSLVPYVDVGTATVTAQPVSVCVGHTPYLYGGTVSTPNPSVVAGQTNQISIDYSGSPLPGSC